MKLKKLEDEVDRLMEKAEASPWVKYGISFLPGGVVFEGELCKRIRREREDRLKLFSDELAMRMKTIEDGYIKQEYMESDRFLHLFENILKSVIDTQQREKIVLLASVVESSISMQRTADALENFFIRCINNLDINHISVMSRLYDLGQEGKVYYSLRKLAGAVFPSEEMLAIQSELFSMRLLEARRSADVFVDFPEVKLTSLGIQLLNFIKP